MDDYNAKIPDNSQDFGDIVGEMAEAYYRKRLGVDGLTTKLEIRNQSLKLNNAILEYVLKNHDWLPKDREWIEDRIAANKALTGE